MDIISYHLLFQIKIFLLLSIMSLCVSRKHLDGAICAQCYFVGAGLKLTGANMITNPTCHQAI